MEGAFEKVDGEFMPVGGTWYRKLNILRRTTLGQTKIKVTIKITLEESPILFETKTRIPNR